MKDRRSIFSSSFVRRNERLQRGSEDQDEDDQRSKDEVHDARGRQCNEQDEVWRLPRSYSLKYTRHYCREEEEEKERRKKKEERKRENKNHT